MDELGSLIPATVNCANVNSNTTGAVSPGPSTSSQRGPLVSPLVVPGAARLNSPVKKSNILECRVCEDTFQLHGDKIPRLLFCGHTLCHACLLR